MRPDINQPTAVLTIAQMKNKLMFFFVVISTNGVRTTTQHLTWIRLCRRVVSAICKPCQARVTMFCWLLIDEMVLSWFSYNDHNSPPQIAKRFYKSPLPPPTEINPQNKGREICVHCLDVHETWKRIKLFMLCNDPGVDITYATFLGRGYFNL